MSFLGSAVIALILMVFIYFRSGRDVLDKTFSLILVSSAVWSFGLFMTIYVGSLENALFWRRIMDSGAILIPAFWMHFVYAMLGFRNKAVLITCYLASFVLLALNTADNWIQGLFINGMIEKDVFRFYVDVGFGYYLFFLYFWLVVTYSLFLLFKSYKANSGLRAQQIKYVGFAALFGFSGGGMSFLLSFNIPIPPYGIILFAFYPVVIFYAITRYHLLDIKVITTELLTFSIWAFLLVRLFINPNLEAVLINGVLFVVILVFGVLLIKSVLNEVREREELEKTSASLEDLKSNLEKKIVEQTENVKRAYEVEKKARLDLEELDKAKDQFVLTTQHHLRTPLTIIKGYLDAFGRSANLSLGVEPILGNMNKSVEIISKSVSNLLQATEMKVGKNDGS